MEQFDNIRKLIGTKSSSLNRDIKDIFNSGKDRFIDLQEAIDYIEMTDDFNVTDDKYEQLTLGYLLSADVRYVCCHR